MDRAPAVMTDEQVVHEALSDKAAFGEIVERYQEKLGRYITRLGVRDPDDRDDVLQDIFVKVYRNLNGFDTSLSFSSWIYRIAHNEAISWYRKKNVRPEGHLVADSDVILELTKAEDEHSEVVFDQSVNAEALTKAIDELDERYRSVLLLRYFEHKEYAEISDILKIPIGSVGTLIHRGKRQLKELLDPNVLRV